MRANSIKIDGSSTNKNPQFLFRIRTLTPSHFSNSQRKLVIKKNDMDNATWKKRFAEETG